MYLRESRRTNEDGSVVAYLQQTGNSVAKVIHNFGRADQVGRGGAGPAGGVDLPVADPGAGRGRRRGR
jgi:hypothetical protein